MGRVLALTLAVALAGCAVPPPAGVRAPQYSPTREAFAYFPQDAPIVALVATDPQDPGLRRLGASGALRPLKRAAAKRDLYFAQLRPLLGNAAVVGEPSAGAAPLAVLATSDAVGLELLAQARVRSGTARPAGSYRGSDLFAEDGWAFAVRDRVLLASATTGDLIAAIDTRLDADGFEAAQLNDVQPDPDPPASFARVYVDLASLVDRGGAAIRAVPLLRALGPAGVSVGASAEELRATLETDASGVGLISDDLPELEPGGRRPAVPADEPALATTDFEGLAAAAETALREALPVSALKLEALRSAGFPLTPELLAGSAVVTDGPAIRIDSTNPVALRNALQRIKGRLDHGFRVYRGVRFGFSGNTFVAGRVSAARLRRLGSAGTVAAQSPILLRLPSVAPWFERPLVLTLNGTLEALRVDAYSGF